MYNLSGVSLEDTVAMMLVDNLLEIVTVYFLYCLFIDIEISFLNMLTFLSLHAHPSLFPSRAFHVSILFKFNGS